MLHDKLFKKSRDKFIQDAYTNNGLELIKMRDLKDILKLSDEQYFKLALMYGGELIYVDYEKDILTEMDYYKKAKVVADYMTQGLTLDSICNYVKMPRFFIKMAMDKRNEELQQFKRRYETEKTQKACAGSL